MVIDPVYDYYKKLFKDEGGDCYDFYQMADACDIFNPLYLKDIDETKMITVLYGKAEKLKFFKYKRIFDDDFIGRLKKEMPNVLEVAKEDHNLDAMEGSRQYYTRLQKKMIRHNVVDKESMDWKNDAGEYAHRIWKWWMTKVTEFPCHALAIRLVVLTQMSSCSVERVFSRLQQIQDRCGNHLYEDMTEIRLFLQCNGDLNELYDSLSSYLTTE